MKLLIIIFFVLFQRNPEYVFVDSCGNKIVIENYKEFPKSIDSTFIKNNLNSSMLSKEFCEKEYKFEISIVGIKKLSKNKFDVRVNATPKDDKHINMQERFRYMGYSHYLMKTSKENNKLILKEIKWIYGEI